MPKKRIYQLKNILSISKIAKLGKRKKECKRFWVRKIYEERETWIIFHTLSWFEGSDFSLEHLLELVYPKI